MVKVVQDNSRWKGRCLECGSIFSYKVKDLKFKTYKQRWITNDPDIVQINYLLYKNVIKCPCCKKWIARDPDNMDNFICADFLN